MSDACAARVDEAPDPGASLKREQKIIVVRGSFSLASKSSRTATSSTPFVSMTEMVNSPKLRPKSGIIRSMLRGRETSFSLPLFIALKVSVTHSIGFLRVALSYQISRFVLASTAMRPRMRV